MKLGMKDLVKKEERTSFCEQKEAKKLWFTGGAGTAGANPRDKQKFFGSSF